MLTGFIGFRVYRVWGLEFKKVYPGLTGVSRRSRDNPWIIYPLVPNPPVNRASCQTVLVLYLSGAIRLSGANLGFRILGFRVIKF